MLLVCGEALIDLFVEGGPGLAVQAAAGGSPFNVAIGLARLGRQAAFLGGLSDDIFGDHLAGLLAAEGVGIAVSRRSPRPTTLSFVSHGADGTVRYAFRGEDAADRDVTADDLPATLPAEIGCITLGSYSLAVEPVGSTLARFAETVGPERVISLDPNVRPTLIGDRRAWRTRFDRLVALSAIVKASDEDLTHGFGGATDPAAVAADWAKAGPAMVVITRGGRPALAVGAFGELEVPVRPVAVMDTVGAGDSFHAALLAALDREGVLSRRALAHLDRSVAERCLAFAAAAAALTCSRRGADLPRLAEVQAALPG